MPETGILPQHELDDMRLMLTPESHQQELECSFDAAILGAYFAKELDEAQSAGRIGSVPYDALLPVHSAWDLGIGDSTAIWFFQVARAEVRVIDYYEASGYGLPHYAAVLSSRGYKYGTDYLPHDAQAPPARHRPVTVGDAAQPRHQPHPARAAAAGT